MPIIHRQCCVNGHFADSVTHTAIYYAYATNWVIKFDVVKLKDATSWVQSSCRKMTPACENMKLGHLYITCSWH